MNQPVVIQWHDPILWVVAVFVFGHALVRFNTPPTSRSLTTFRRFYIASGLYSLAAVVWWGTLTFLPPGFVQLFFAGWPKDLQGVAWPFATALVVTSMVQVPGIQALDARIRSAFHQFARVTEEANALSQRLRRTSVLVDENMKNRVRTALETQQLDGNDIVFGPSGDARTSWVRTTTLKLIVTDWQHSGDGFQRFHAANHVEIEEALGRYAALESTARKTFSLLSRLRRERDDLTASKLITELESDIGQLSRTRDAEATAEVRERIHRRLLLLGQLDMKDESGTLGQEAAKANMDFSQAAATVDRPLLRLVARATLEMGRTPRARTNLLRAMGFQEVARRRDSLPDRLTGLFLVLFLFYPVQLVLSGGEWLPRILTGATIAIVYAAAILLAVYPKRWTFFQRTDNVRPLRAYVVSALLAVTAWAVAFTGLWSTISASGAEALQSLATRWPWVVMAATTAFVTAWSADNRLRPRLRWMETAGQAAATTLAAAVVIALLRTTAGAGAAMPWLGARTYVILASAALTGALIGFLVPKWYRDSRQEREADARESMSGDGSVMERGQPAAGMASVAAHAAT